MELALLLASPRAAVATWQANPCSGKWWSPVRLCVTQQGDSITRLGRHRSPLNLAACWALTLDHNFKACSSGCFIPFFYGTSWMMCQTFTYFLPCPSLEYIVVASTIVVFHYNLNFGFYDVKFVMVGKDMVMYIFTVPIFNPFHSHLQN